MRFSLIAHPFDVASMTDPAVLSEQLGYDALYVGDHLFYYAEPARPWLDGWPVLAMRITPTLMRSSCTTCTPRWTRTSVLMGSRPFARRWRRSWRAALKCVTSHRSPVRASEAPHG